ncbi:MAG TPA: response regulator [Polyangiaceae bacterium]
MTQILPPSLPAADENQASAVAHELNNVLTVIRTYTHFARQPTTPERCAQDLRVIAGAAERASALVDWLASRSESAPRAADELSANEFVSSVTARLEQLIQPGTTIQIMREGGDVWFRANASRLEHVVMSLVLAASQRWGEAAFKFSVSRVPGGAAEPASVSAGPYALLSITCVDARRESDWQARLVPSPDQVFALLEPLGDLLRSMNGRLELIRCVASEERFEIYFPALPERDVRPSQSRLAIAPPGASTVCVVENETAIRLAMVRTLSGAGYFVVEANDGIAAREAVIRHGLAARLLICDVGLLRDGQEFFAWIRATCPGAGLLLISGNEQEGQARASSLRARFLAKPFTPAELVACARDTIARGEADERGSVDRRVVLLVDDELVIRESFERLLAECGFEIVVADSGLRALQILNERHVDAIVSDQFMPGLDGIELLELVRVRFPSCVRVLCTGQPASDVVTAALRRGQLQHVLAKSTHAVALRDAIERAILQGLAAIR